MLKHSEVAAYLLQRRLIDASTIVAGELRIEDVSRRNSVFKVIGRDSPCYLLKQGVGPEGAATVAHEAAVYQLLRSSDADNRLARYLPGYYGYDAQEQLLTLELLRDAQDLRVYHARRGRISARLAAALGDALAILHQLSVPADGWDTAGGRFVGQPPWILASGCPDHTLLIDLSSAGLQLLRMIQQSDVFCQDLDALRQGWRAETLIHQDIKWENCIVVPQPASARSLLKIVDWELANLGDPCWDVGALFGDYLGSWLLSIPFAGDGPPDQFIDLARYPLNRMQPAIRSAWQAYARRMKLEAATAAQWLLRVVRYTAARLIQTAFEHAQTATFLAGNIAGLLQLSFNILRRPHEALVHLLGIPVSPMSLQ
ncbi:MAG TPA: phosphotransferase [Roseiflexaceae bacterium]|nr:phosphotransferase [Roseiflexaceae bacterium]